MATSSNSGPPERSPRKRARLRAALETIVPAERFGDERTILAGTGQSVVGLVVAIVATFATQVLITRGMGAAAYGIVTLATQGALVLGFFSRFGMDMAAVRRVAIDLGQGERSRVRSIVGRASVIASMASVVVGAGVFALASRWPGRSSPPGWSRRGPRRSGPVPWPSRSRPWSRCTWGPPGA